MNIVIKNEGEFSNIIIYLYKENKKKTKIKVGTISQKELDIDINIYRYNLGKTDFIVYAIEGNGSIHDHCRYRSHTGL